MPRAASLHVCEYGGQLLCAPFRRPGRRVVHRGHLRAGTGPPVHCGELAERGGQVQLCAPVEEIARQIFGALLATTDRPRPQRRPSMETARGRRTPRRAGVPVRLVPGSAK